MCIPLFFIKIFMMICGMLRTIFAHFKVKQKVKNALYSYEIKRKNCFKYKAIHKLCLQST